MWPLVRCVSRERCVERMGIRVHGEGRRCLRLQTSPRFVPRTLAPEEMRDCGRVAEDRGAGGLYFQAESPLQGSAPAEGQWENWMGIPSPRKRSRRRDGGQGIRGQCRAPRYVCMQGKGKHCRDPYPFRMQRRRMSKVPREICKREIKRDEVFQMFTKETEVLGISRRKPESPLRQLFTSKRAAARFKFPER